MLLGRSRLTCNTARLCWRKTREAGILLRSVSQFEVWAGFPAPPGELRLGWTQPAYLPSPSFPALSVLLFGFAGSKKHQLEKISLAYNRLGYQTLYCILPLQHLFYYDIPKIRECAQQVAEVAASRDMNRLVCHSFSNNGGALYQQFSRLVAEEHENIQIEGAIFDSAPGPGSIQEVLSAYVPSAASFLPPLPDKLRSDDVDHGGPQRIFLRGAYAAVNWTNGLSLVEIIKEAKLQKRAFKETLPYKDEPWVGSYLKYQEPHSWPTMFLASKKDKQIPWSYVESVATAHHRRGRCPPWQASLQLFQDSGHVAHYKTQPMEYTGTVSKFLLSIERKYQDGRNKEQQLLLVQEQKEQEQGQGQKLPEAEKDDQSLAGPDVSSENVTQRLS